MGFVSKSDTSVSCVIAGEWRVRWSSEEQVVVSIHNDAVLYIHGSNEDLPGVLRDLAEKLNGISEMIEDETTKKIVEILKGN